MLGRKREEWEAKKGIYTAEEILQQPETWEKTMAMMDEIGQPLQAFLDDILNEEKGTIILTGAGTSEYVGNALLPALMKGYEGAMYSFGTTDIVASPETYIPEDKPLLLVSFARSGNSPESVGAVKAVDRINPEAKHLFITCNKDGELARLAAGREDCFSILLAPETCDRGFAMTSSFTNMYLAALLALATDVKRPLEEAIRAGTAFASEGFKSVDSFVSKNDFNRIVYLGSGVLKGIAQESALKILELTGGQIAAFYDTPMGFRHGPKSVIDKKTVTVVYLSEDPWTRRYEMDLLKEVYRDRGGSRIIAVATGGKGSRDLSEMEANCDQLILVEAESGEEHLSNSVLALPYVMMAQTVALFCSLKLGITPDDPCPTGEVNRVVQGVTIYE